jgi:CDP-glycerol glycerophosphotransferase
MRSAVVPLLVSSGNGPPLPARSGEYEVLTKTPDGTPMPLLLSAELPAPQFIPAVTRVAFRPVGTGLTVVLSSPLTDRERGPLQQESLESDYRAASFEPLNAVFFESFYGQNASCNPLAIDRELARVRPDIGRYWSVIDASVRVPDGAIALLEGSAEWWRIRGSARLIVVNDWVRKRLRKRRYQTVLQTWHGTMLKKLALSRGRTGLRPAIAALVERRQWDILLAQNPHSRKIFRTAYAYFGVVWEEGYPRDDVLVTGDPRRPSSTRYRRGSHRAALRANLARRPSRSGRPPRRRGIRRTPGRRVHHTHSRPLPHPSAGRGRARPERV